MKSTFIKVMAAVVLATSLHADSSKSLKKELKSVHKKLDDITKLELRLNKMAPKPITQKKIDEAGGTLVLNCSGDYCLTENVTGALLVHADSVCIDLCCHTLNADGRANAIVADGYQGLKVFDGRIINSTSSAISVNNYSAVELFKLVLTDNTTNGLLLANSTDVSVHDVDCINDGAGERAVYFDTCSNIVLNHLNASGFLSTIGAIVQLDRCAAASIQDVDISDSVKSVASPAGSYDPASMMVCVNESPGTDLVHVKVNNNTINTTAVGNRRFSAIGFMSSPNCSMRLCQTCNNVDINGDVGNELTSFLGLDRQVFIGRSDNVIVTEHQANNNSCTVPISDFRMYAPLDSRNVVFDGCEANSNSVAELAVNLVFDSYFAGFIVQYQNIIPDNAVIRNCQANFNSIQNGGSGRDPSSNVAQFQGIRLEGSGVIDSCQTSNNAFLDGQPVPRTQAIGIYAVNGTSVTIINSSSDNNRGAEIGAGISFFSDFAPASNCAIRNCSAHANGNYGLMLGNPLARTGTSNAEVVDCMFNGNGNNFSDAAGIIVEPFEPNFSNVFIKDCQIYDTFSGGSDAVGIRVIYANNVVIEDCNIFNSTADAFGHGIQFDSVTDSKIIRTQVHGNQNSGIELTGVNTNIMILDSIAIDNDVGFSVASGSTLEGGIIQGNRALGNTTIGFEHAAVLPAPFDTSYQGNYAQDNGTNYSISNVIQIHTYAIPTATYVFSAGGTNFPTLTNIDAS